MLGGWFDGGAGAVVKTGKAEDPQVIARLVKRGYFTCSYDEEANGLDMTLDLLEQNGRGPVSIVTDSQSLCMALMGVGFELDEMRYRLRNYPFKLYLQWIPGHKNIPGNDMADEVAKEATEIRDAPHTSTWFHSTRARLRSLWKDMPSSHERTRKVYSAYSKSKEEEVLSRSDQTLLAKLRTGHTVLFKEYLNKIDETKDPTCPLCQQAPHSLTHWMCECAGTLQKRFELLGPDDYNKLKSLTKRPLEVIALAKATLGVSE